MQSIVSYNQLKKINYHLYSSIVVVGGCFDILHYGHLVFLEEAKKKGEKLIILLESDQFIIEVKKRKPVHTEKERAYMLSLLRCVDQVIILPRLKTYEEYEEIIKYINPSIIAVTEGDPQMENKKKMIKKIGGTVMVVTGYIPNVSTSEIREKLKKLD